MVELVDTLASGASGSDTVRVQLSLSPQRIRRAERGQSREMIGRRVKPASRVRKGSGATPPYPCKQ